MALKPNSYLVCQLLSRLTSPDDLVLEPCTLHPNHKAAEDDVLTKISSHCGSASKRTFVIIPAYTNEFDKKK